MTYFTVGPFTVQYLDTKVMMFHNNGLTDISVQLLKHSILRIHRVNFQSHPVNVADIPNIPNASFLF